MKILICNDDGYQAPGIIALYEALQSMGEVEVIAPELNNSAKSNALTLSTPLSVRRASNGFRYINGTPADCVHIALTGLLDYRPDLVVSGINNGANMGDDTLYSGTVGAAMEGYLMGIPSIACSQVQKGWNHLDAAAQAVGELVDRLKNVGMIGPIPWLLNVNVPNVPKDQIKPLKICRLGRRHSAEPVITQVNPMGETMYWIGGAGAVKDDAPGTDFHATFEGHMAVTPLQIDLTDHEQLRYWGQVSTQLVGAASA
jgi:5'-nucleotidase